jgi:small subunit ribosomal protein S6
MRHYEIMFLIHPDQSDQVRPMIQRYTQLIQSGNGKIHRLEDLGRSELAYPIEKLHKIHYLLMNIECDQAVINSLKESFVRNDAILLHDIFKQNRAITEPSPLARAKKSAAEAPRKTFVRTTTNTPLIDKEKSTETEVNTQAE